jgi:hypothetical protein
MGHTNDAAKSARLKMLADTVRFGTGAVFVTVTPDDSNCLQIKIYVEPKCDIHQETLRRFQHECATLTRFSGIVCIQFSTNNGTHD